MIITLNKNNMQKEVYDSTKPVIIDVYAKWCGPCQHMKPIFEQLAQELSSQYTFAELNVDEAREAAVTLGISSVPTFVFIKEGKIVGKETGSMPQEDLKQKIQEYLG
ncbi:MAG: thioredoxin [Candidatus Babeliaceae bacterium]